MSTPPSGQWPSQNPNGQNSDGQQPNGQMPPAQPPFGQPGSQAYPSTSHGQPAHQSNQSQPPAGQPFGQPQPTAPRTPFDQPQGPQTQNWGPGVAATQQPQAGTDAAGESVGGSPAGRPVGREGARVDIEETKAWYIGGGLAFLLGLAILAGAVFLVVRGSTSYSGGGAQVLLGVLLFVLGLLVFSSLTIVQPGSTKVVQFFGKYIGTIRKTGLLMTVPFTGKRNVSVKVRNFETHELKVNDADGNPINIAAIIVWQVADTAKSVFAVEAYDQFVAVQSESALRHVATSHPYDNAAPGEETLRGSTELVSQELADEVAARIAIAGLEVVEARISSLAYAPEIAQAMLQRQQASAVIAAREKIVEGAVSMVQNALERLDQEKIVELDDDKKAAMVSNLMVVLCSDSAATPMINTTSPTSSSGGSGW